MNEGRGQDDGKEAGQRRKQRKLNVKGRTVEKKKQKAGSEDRREQGKDEWVVGK